MTMTAANVLSTTVYLANLYPNWNSLDSVRLAHSRFELASIVFFGLLAVAEAIAHRLKEGVAKHRLDMFGIVFFVIAVLCEGAAYPYSQRNDELSENVIRSLDSLANDAEAKSAKAVIQAGDAGAKSATAVVTAANANVLATGAIKEADAYARDIAAAKEESAGAVKEAVNAVSRLAEAEKRLAESTEREAAAEAKLAAIKTPRSLQNIPGFIAALKPFAGTEYTFSSVFSDKESIDLLIDIDKNLTEAGWKRVKPPPGFPAINVYGKDVDFAVISSLEDGTRVTIESQSPPESLQSTPPTLRLSNVNAALALNVALSTAITPPQKSADGPVHVDKGDSKIVVMMIGKKE